MTTGKPELRGPLAMFRTSLVAICALLSIAPSGQPVALFVLLPISVGALGAYRSVRFARAWPYAAALLCACAVPFTGGGRSSLLAYLMASALTLGLTRGVRELLMVSGSTSAVLLLGPLVTDVGSLDDYFIGSAEWVVLALAVGLVPVWSRRLHLMPDHDDDYLEVRQLLKQLRNVARHLPGTLDTSSAAEALLERCARTVAVERGAVIVQTSASVFVPLAVTGVTRVPWRGPFDQGGPLSEAWRTGLPAWDSREVDVVGRRRGSTLLALPLPSRQGPLGLVVLEAAETDAFSTRVVETLMALARSVTPQLEAAMMFEEVRLEASIEERDRLAREMHDGIAQELAVLGYRLDQVAMRAHVVDEGLAEEVGLLRKRLTTLMSELRLSITHLRATVRPTQGLGAALSTYLPAVCSGREIVLNLSLTESSFRLPAEQEAALLKAAQVFAQEVRRTPDAHSLCVALSVDPPSALLTMSCDVALLDLRMDEIRGFLATIGGDVSLCLGVIAESCVTITLEGDQDDNLAAGGRPRVDPARAEASLRAD